MDFSTAVASQTAISEWKQDVHRKAEMTHKKSWSIGGALRC